ncbi:MAG: nitroreductase family protein [Candidatus Ranarchaeia archaeon]
METLEAIEKRQSIRLFKPDPVPDDVIRQILRSAMRAPSAGNQQPVEYVVCTDSELKKQVGEAGFQKFLVETPVLIAVLINDERTVSHYGERGRKLYAIQDSAAVVENILLAATALGLGSCWCGAFREEKVREALQLPDKYRPVALVAIGKPLKTPPKTSRRPFDVVVHWNSRYPEWSRP